MCSFQFCNKRTVFLSENQNFSTAPCLWELVISMFQQKQASRTKTSDCWRRNEGMPLGKLIQKKSYCYFLCSCKTGYYKSTILVSFGSLLADGKYRKQICSIVVNNAYQISVHKYKRPEDHIFTEFPFLYFLMYICELL